MTKNEFNEVCKRLGEIDLVYEIMALFAVETALRIDAIMKIDENDFNGYFKVAQSQSKKISREYLVKYNKVFATNVIRVLWNNENEIFNKVHKKQQCD